MQAMCRVALAVFWEDNLLMRLGLVECRLGSIAQSQTTEQ